MYIHLIVKFDLRAAEASGLELLGAQPKPRGFSFHLISYIYIYIYYLFIYTSNFIFWAEASGLELQDSRASRAEMAGPGSQAAPNNS